jgi:branched-chain amino acid transport system permease protein
MTVPEMTTIFQFFVNGIVLGLLYVLMALGLSIIFGMIGVVNMAHGVLYMLGAYATVTVASHTGFFPALVLSPVLVALVGMTIESLFLRTLYKGDPALGLLFTFGLAMLLEQLVRVVWGTQGLPFQIPEGLRGALTFGPIIYSKYRYFIVGCALAVVGGLWLFLEKTPVGLIVRAGSRDPDMVRALGINLKPVFTLVFGLGAAMAAVSGALNSALAGVEPAMGTNTGTAAFVVVVIGGLGSFWGAVMAGLMVGEVVSFSILFWPPMAEASMFALMIVVLLARPRGLFGVRWERFE